MQNYCVYKHTAPDGRVYIGATGKAPKKRWDNGNGYKYCSRMWDAIEAFGWDNFSHEIIASGLTQEEAHDLEVKLIHEYRSNDPDFGLNLESGGRIGYSVAEETKVKRSRSLKGHKTSETTRARISEALTGKALSPEHIAKIRENGKKRAGIPLSEETKKKISRTLSGRVRTPEHCQHIREAHLGKIFHSEETKRKISESKKNSPATLRGSNNPKAHPVVCVETGEVFGSQAEAAAAKGIETAGNISRSCRKGLKCGGFHWRFYENFSSEN